MDFKDQIKKIAAKISRIRDQNKGDLGLTIRTEEATKQAFVVEFIAALGYDVFDPAEVVPEFTADFGTKKGEKVDYAIYKDGVPVILFECKWCGLKLDDNLHGGQLFRYYSTKNSVKFGVLTNGVQYRLFTELDAPNQMDDKPFLEFDICNISESTVNELKKFRKSDFNSEAMITAARKIRWTREVKDLFAEQMENPSDDFVKFIGSKLKTINKSFTVKITAQFSDIIRLALKDFIADRIQDILKKVQTEVQPTAEKVLPAAAKVGADTVKVPPTPGKIAPTVKKAKPVKAQPAAVKVVPSTDNHPTDPDEDEPDDETHVASPEELQAFETVKSLLKGHVDLSKVAAKPGKTYFTVVWDDNGRKPICRLHFHRKKKLLGLFDGKNRKENGQMAETRVALDSVADIKKHAEQIRAAASAHQGASEPEVAKAGK